jgi:hypothetical protein
MEIVVAFGIGILSLVALIAMMYLGFILFAWWDSNKPYDFSDEEVEVLFYDPVLVEGELYDVVRDNDDDTFVCEKCAFHGRQSKFCLDLPVDCNENGVHYEGRGE